MLNKRLKKCINCVLKRGNQKGLERSKKINTLKYRNSFLKNRFSILNNFVDSKDLSKQSLTLVILCLSMQKHILIRS